MRDVNQLTDLIERYCSADWKFLIKERSTTQTHKAKEFIFREGQPMTHLAIINSGKVKLYASFGNKREYIFRFATEGQAIGHRGMGSDYTFPISACTLTDTEITVIPLPLFESVLLANAEFCYYFMLYFAEELRRSEKLMKDLSFMNLRQRVAAALKINADTFGFDKTDRTRLNFTISRKDIASLAGTTYESVIRTLSDFEKEKVIVIRGKEICIPDLSVLEQVIERGFI